MVSSLRENSPQKRTPCLDDALDWHFAGVPTEPMNLVWRLVDASVKVKSVNLGQGWRLATDSDGSPALEGVDLKDIQLCCSH